MSTREKSQPQIEQDLEKLLLNLNLLSRDLLKDYKDNPSPPSLPLKEFILEQGLIDEETLARLVAMAEEQVFSCLYCDGINPAADFERPEDFICTNCDRPLFLTTITVPSGAEHQSSQKAPSPDSIHRTSQSKNPKKFTLSGQREIPVPSPPQTSSRRLEIGSVIEGDIALIRLIGQGGMGAVFSGYQYSLKRKVAVKVISPGASDKEEILTRFSREARITAELNHPNIVKIYSSGIHKDHPYLVMEFIEGRTLKEMLVQRPLNPEESLKITIQIAKGLSEAHKKGILHRDIKPDNIFITNSGLVKLVDFGISQKEDLSRITRAGAILGTPAYMSPEQAQGKKLGPESDIFSLGATWYHCLTGRPPFQGENPLTVLHKIVNYPVHFSKDHRDSLPKALCKIIEEMMEPDKFRRIKSAEDLLDKLMSLQTALDETGEYPPEIQGKAFAKDLPSTQGESPRTLLSRRSFFMGIFALLVLMVGVFLFLIAEKLLTSRKNKESLAKSPSSQKEENLPKPPKELYFQKAKRAIQQEDFPKAKNSVEKLALAGGSYPTWIEDFLKQYRKNTAEKASKIAGEWLVKILDKKKEKDTLKDQWQEVKDRWERMKRERRKNQDHREKAFRTPQLKRFMKRREREIKTQIEVAKSEILRLESQSSSAMEQMYTHRIQKLQSWKKLLPEKDQGRELLESALDFFEKEKKAFEK